MKEFPIVQRQRLFLSNSAGLVASYRFSLNDGLRQSEYQSLLPRLQSTIAILS